MYWKRPKKSVLPYFLAFFIGKQSVFRGSHKAVGAITYRQRFLLHRVLEPANIFPQDFYPQRVKSANCYIL